MQKSNLIFATMGLVLLVNTTRLTAQTPITVKQIDGTESKYTITQDGKLFFTDSSIFINDGLGNPVETSLAQIQSIVFDNENGITNISLDNLTKIYPNPATTSIRISGVENSTDVYLYSVSGMLIDHFNYEVGNDIDISHLCAGFYLLRINNKTLKFSKL